jgi:hypothetical protein
MSKFGSDLIQSMSEALDHSIRQSGDEFMWIMIAFIIYSDTAFDYEIQGFSSQDQCEYARIEVKEHYPTDEIKVYSVCLEE